MIQLCYSNNSGISEYCLNITSLGVGILSLIVAVLTLWTAQTINKNMTIHKYIYERQIETIFKLISDLQSLKFVVMDLNGQTNVLSYNTLESQLTDTHFAILKDRKLLVTADFFNNFPIINYYGNPFIPPELAKSIEELCFKPTIANIRQQYPDHVVISCGREDLNSVSIIDQKTFDTFGSFVNSITVLKSEIRSWTKGRLNL